MGDNLGDNNLQDLILGLKEKEKSEEKSEKHLEPKPFVWDNIIFYLAYAILGLSAGNVVVDFTSPEPNTVECYASRNTSDDQSDYINNYCYKHLPFTQNFAMALVIHGTALLVPYFFWNANFSARIEFFFSHAAQLKTLRERNTGEYPHKNFNVVNYMHREFHDRRDILIGYIIKLIAQLCIVLLATSITVWVFQDFDIEFDCPKNGEHHFFGRVSCTYAKLQFISVLRWIDHVLLCIAFLALLYGLYWCIVRSHPELGYEKVSQFCYDSCINSRYYKPTKWYRLRNDQQFLLLSLYATNAGLGRVYRSLQIADKIRHELDAHFELLDNYISMKHSHERDDDKKKNEVKAFKDSEAIAKVMYEICKKISGKQEECGVRSSVMSAMDIACGYHSYLFAIAREQLQVISIILDPYYSNPTQVLKCEEHTGVRMMRIPTNLFGLPTKHKEDFATKIQLYVGYDEEGKGDRVAKFSLFVIGPVDDERKYNAVNQINEMLSRTDAFFIDGCIMLIVQPLDVEGKSVENVFVEMKPESQKFWHETHLLHILDWVDREKDIVEFIDDRVVIKVNCGDQACKFELKTYCFGKVPAKLLVKKENMKAGRYQNNI